MAEEITNIQEQQDSTRVLLAIHKKSGQAFLAVTAEQYASYDKRSWATDAVIIRDDEDTDLLIALEGVQKTFGEGPSDIPADDKRRKNYVSPQMTIMDGADRTAYLYSNHKGDFPDDCALCYCIAKNMFLPAGGEMQKVRDYLDEVNALLDLAGGSRISGTHWLSTMYSEDYPWHMDVDGNTFGFWLSKENALKVRPMGDASRYEEIV